MQQINNYSAKSFARRVLHAGGALFYKISGIKLRDKMFSQCESKLAIGNCAIFRMNKFIYILRSGNHMHLPQPHDQTGF